MYQAPPKETTVICLDELGPLSAKTYVGHQWSQQGNPSRIDPDYGRRAYTWVFGAFEPATGIALTQCQSRRRTVEFTQLLDAVVEQWSSKKLILILDNLSVHRSQDVLLWSLAHPHVQFLFQPTYAPWLNLIEPWWKTLRSLSLKGRRFDDIASLRSSIVKVLRVQNTGMPIASPIAGARHILLLNL